MNEKFAKIDSKLESARRFLESYGRRVDEFYLSLKTYMGKPKN